MAAALALGAVVGGLLGLLGGGGSILAVPALVYGLGQTVGTAVPTSLLVVGAAAAIGAIPKMRHGDVRWGIALVFGGAAIATAFAGAWVNHRLDDATVLVAFALLMALVGVRMLRGGDPVEDREVDRVSPGRWALVVGVGAGVGFLTGLFGVGGGFVIVPALVLLLGLPMHVAVGTSLVVIVMTAAAGFSAHLRTATVDLPTAGAFAAGAIVAVLLVDLVGRRLDERLLRRGFGVLVLLVAAGVLASVSGIGPSVPG